MNNRIANDLIRYAELVEDGALISPEEMNCASVMRLAAEALAHPAVTESHKREPVAIQYASKAERDLYEMEDEDDTTPYVATPRPQRTAAEGEDTRRAWVNATTWRGLTDEEKQQIMWTFTGHTGLFKHFKYMEAVEAKLKAKNERKEKNA